MTRTQAKEIIRLRRKLALEIADTLERHFETLRHRWDTDIAARLIETHIPLTAIEAEAEFVMLEKNEDSRQKRKGPGIGERIRKALGYSDRDSAPLGVVLEAAIEAIEERNRYRMSGKSASGQS